MKLPYKILVIGGSAGSFPIIGMILSQLPKDFELTTVLCLHRLKTVRHGFAEALNIKSTIKVIEPEDKQTLKPNQIYLAPANYHLLIEDEQKFALSTEEVVRFSRPSIDRLFISAAEVFTQQTIGVLLSGANSDGAYGMQKIKEKGGCTLVQDPETCTVNTMTSSAIQATKIDYILEPNKIVPTILSLL